MKVVLPLIMMMLAVSACEKHKKPEPIDIQKQQKLKDNRFAGIWLERQDAEELRQTNKLESRCQEIRNNPDLRYSNLNRIDAYGNLFVYLPDMPPNRGFRERGVIQNDGTLRLSRSELARMYGYQASVDLDENGILNVTFYKTSFAVTQQFLRSNASEASTYQAAIESCLLRNGSL